MKRFVLRFRAKMTTLSFSLPTQPLLVLVLLLVSSMVTSAHASSFLVKETIWARSYIDVCWENPSVSNATERQWVENAANNSWARYSDIEFIGWQMCQTRSKGIRININDQKPFSKGLGTSVNGKHNGVQLNFTFANWTADVCVANINAQTKQACIETLTVHEFGHALGFAHEYSGSAGSCDIVAQGQVGNRSNGDWDQNSVMNYCNSTYLGSGNLSDGDIAMVQHYYGDGQQKKLSFIVDSQVDPQSSINFSTADTCSMGGYVDTYSDDYYANENTYVPQSTLSKNDLLGEYRQTGHFNNSPLYTHLDPTKPFYIYQRRTNEWVIDHNKFNDQGTDELAISAADGQLPWLAGSWNHDITVVSNSGSEACGALVKLSDGVSWIEKDKYQQVIHAYVEAPTPPSGKLTLLDDSRNIQLIIDVATNTISDQVHNRSRIDFRSTIRSVQSVNGSTTPTHIEYGHAACPDVAGN
ncbi:MAG: hypothetical protein ACI8WB_000186 [Phenylobacterium sp.]|jgi:hypothetical protein